MKNQPKPNWRNAYLEQARSEYKMLVKLQASKEPVPLCHQLHYLQMTTEKLAKGLLTKPDGPRFPKTHNAFVRFVQTAKGRPEVMRAWGFTSHKQFVEYIDDSLAPLAQDIENLSPEGSDHPNPEYPWEAGGTIHVPVAHSFSDIQIDSTRMIKMLEFVGNCIRLT